MCFGTYNFNNDLQKVDTSQIFKRIFDEAMDIHNDFFKRYYDLNCKKFIDPLSDLNFGIVDSAK